MTPKQIKLITALVIAAVAGFIFWQNREEIVVHVLMFSVTTSRASALGLSFLCGVLVGFLAFSRWTSKKGSKTEPSQGA